MLACARCSVERWGLRAVWRALNRIGDPPELDAEPLGPVLLDHPGACCSECGQSFWLQLPFSGGAGPGHYPPQV